ncbi:MAG: DUF3352 domain-containing protein [Leptolyngbyaceae cyanobacterium]
MVLKQRPPLLVTVSTAVLLVLGGAAAYLGISQRLSAKAQPPAGMALVPSDALVALTLTTDESQWNRLRQLGTPESQKVLDQWLVTWRDRILSANGYRFRPDIQPWVGEQITVAFLPKASANEDKAELVLVVPIADPVKAQELMAEPQEGITWVGRDYKGVGIQSVETATGETFESAVLATKWLVLTSGEKGIEAVIDSFEGGAAMLDDDAYRQAFKHLTTPTSLAQLYVNLPVAAETLAGSNALPDINGLVAAVNPLPNGLDIEASTWLGPEDQPVYVDMANTRSLTPQWLPESTVMMMSTSSIGPLWQALNEAERLNAVLPITSGSLAKGLKTQTGLDFENDVLPWLSGEMAFGLLPPAAESPTSIGQLALVAEVADREAAEATWSQLDEVMANRFRFDVKPSEVESQPVTQLVSHYGGIAMGYGWLGADVTFFGVGTTVVDAIAPRPETSLKANQAFQTLLDISPQDNAGYFFMDVNGLNNFQGSLPFPKLPENPLMSAIKSIGVTTRVQDERRLSYDIFIELPKGRRVTPLPSSNSENESQDEAS